MLEELPDKTLSAFHKCDGQTLVLLYEEEVQRRFQNARRNSDSQETPVQEKDPDKMSESTDGLLTDPQVIKDDDQDGRP